MTRARHPSCRVVAAALAAILATSCSDGGEPAPQVDPDLLLSLDDGAIVIRSADIAPFEQYFEALDATMGVKYRFRELLEQHLIPTLLARRAFPEERAAKRTEAEALRAVAGNSIELQRKGGLAGGTIPEHPLMRNDLPLPVAMWAFRPENLGAVSQPIETARGYVLIAPLDLEPGLTPVGDRLTAFVIEYHTHSLDDFDAWLGGARAEISARVDHVAPKYRDALPRWLRP